MVTAVQYTELSGTNARAELENIESMAVQEVTAGLNVERKMLKKEHTTVWHQVTARGCSDDITVKLLMWLSEVLYYVETLLQLWRSGFSISRSLAADALNGDRINSTLYYLMSSVRAPIHEASGPESRALDDLLHYPDHCYNGHHTL